jgi:hypothetical protein
MRVANSSAEILYSKHVLSKNRLKVMEATAGEAG